MVRYVAFLSYIGTRYRSSVKEFQRPNYTIDLDSIEGVIDVALRSVIHPRSRIPSNIVISSRTDGGVHALHNCLQIELQHPKNILYPSDYLIKTLNSWFFKCGHEIIIRSIYPMTNDFNVRKLAECRTYMYRIVTSKDSIADQTPIGELNRSWHIKGKVNEDILKEAVALFIGKKDFSSFSPKNKTKRSINYVKTILSLTVEPGRPLISEDFFSDNLNYWVITIKARSFVYNQVRRIVGAMVGLALGKISEKDVKVMLQVPSYLNWDERVQPAPPDGLYLKSVEYNQEEFDKCIIKEDAQVE